jgi:hypothetical protein
MKRRFISRLGRLWAALGMLILLAGTTVPATGSAQAGEAPTPTPLFYPRTISTLDYDPRGYVSGPVEWLQIGDDWLAYARRPTPGCGPCGAGIEDIQLYNLLTGQRSQIRGATLLHTYPNAFGVLGLDAGNLHLNGSDLVWSQPSPTLPTPQDPRETYTYNPGQFACTLCHYDVRTGQGGALTGLEERGAPDLSRVRLLDVKIGHVLALLPDAAGDHFWISDIASGQTDQVPVPVVAAEVKEAFLLSDGRTLAWRDSRGHIFIYPDSTGANQLREISTMADLPGVSGQNVVWADGLTFHYVQPGDAQIGTLPALQGFQPNSPYALNATNPAVAWAGPLTGGWTPLNVLAFGSGAGDTALQQGVPGKVQQLWLDGDKLVFVVEQPQPNETEPLYTLQFAWLTTPDSAFADRWARADGPVASGATTRSWLWGPAPFYLGKEQYGTGPDAGRLVQYYDKSRMEINAPSPLPQDKDKPYYVTNGLLVTEMVAGRIRIGDTAEITASVPCTIPVAGDKRADNPLTPDYATLRGVASLTGDNRAPNRIGQPVNEAMDVHGIVSSTKPGAPTAGYASYAAETGHNIPDVFWSYMQGMQGTYGFDWVYVLGYPITEAYWTQMRVAGHDYPVLIQAFQRRVLTYAPDFPADWRVQQGNVGQHYFEWRYILNR